MKGDRGSGLGMGRSISFLPGAPNITKSTSRVQKGYKFKWESFFSGDIYDCCMFPDLDRGESINEGL